MSDTFPSGDATADKAEADHDMTDAADEEVVAEDEKSEEDDQAKVDADKAQVDKDVAQLRSDEGGQPTPAPTPTQPTFYEFVGGNPATIDTTHYLLSADTDDEGNLLYTFDGDVNPGDENGASDEWLVYTGNVVSPSAAEQAARGVGQA